MSIKQLLKDATSAELSPVIASSDNDVGTYGLGDRWGISDERMGTLVDVSLQGGPNPLYSSSRS